MQKINIIPKKSLNRAIHDVSSLYVLGIVADFRDMAVCYLYVRK
jgi:hypothetical protein